MEWRHAADKGTHRAAEEPPIRVCEHPECELAADHRAPRAPDDLRSWRWFCLDHVRDYNRSWNFFAGWNQHDIERFQHDDVTGHRPTWPFCQGPGGQRREDLEAAFRAFSREWLNGEEAPNGRRRTGIGHGLRGQARSARPLGPHAALRPRCAQAALQVASQAAPPRCQRGLARIRGAFETHQSRL